MWITPAYVFEISHEFTQDSFQRCNLPYVLKFSTTNMKYAKDNQEDFRWVVIWAKRVKGKEWKNEFGTIWSYLAK